MRIEIDFDKKTIILKDNVLMGELIEKLKELKLDDWKKWTIMAQEVKIEFIPTQPWVDPIPCPMPYPVPYPVPSVPWQPYTPTLPWITCGTITVGEANNLGLNPFYS